MPSQNWAIYATVDYRIARLCTKRESDYIIVATFCLTGSYGLFNFAHSPDEQNNQGLDGAPTMRLVKTASPKLRDGIELVIEELERTEPMVREQLAMLPNGDIICTTSMERVLRTRYPNFLA